jgi:hypothetical protein
MGKYFNDGRKYIATHLLRTEAAAYLLMARLALALFSFQRLTPFISRRSRRPELTGPDRERAGKQVQSAIFRVCRQGSFETTCLHRAIVAQAMLRRRGVSATLYYGAKTIPDCGLRAHAWVQDGTAGVVGCRVAQRDGYRVLASYPE